MTTSTQRAITTVAILTAFTASCMADAVAQSPDRKCFAVTVTGKGRPMILIPGLESSGEVWNDVVRHFEGRYQVHVLTLAGFAGQPALPGLTLADVRNGIIAYIREKHLDHPVIAGHSLGGFLALWIASTAPDLPERVISVDGLPFLSALMNSSATPESSKADAEKMRAMYSSMTPDQFAAAGKMALSYMISDPKKAEVAAKWAAQSDPGFVAEAVYELMTTDLREDMKSIRRPVLLIGAAKAFAKDQDRLSAVTAAYERQVASIPNHRVEMDVNALHFIMFDDPAFLLNTMDRFLESGAERHAR